MATPPYPLSMSVDDTLEPSPTTQMIPTPVHEEAMSKGRATKQTNTTPPTTNPH